MKEVELKQSDRLEIRAEINQKSEIKFIGSVRAQKGHRLFQLNLETGLITFAKFMDAEIEFAAKNKVKKKVLILKNCLYASALNVKNANKRFNKMLKQ